MKKIETILKDNEAYGATFYEIGEHAPIAGIRRGVKVFRDYECDVIVSVGGGSPIDAAKAILHYSQEETGGPTLLQIAIPTTLSAAEYTVSATIQFAQSISPRSSRSVQALRMTRVIKLG